MKPKELQVKRFILMSVFSIFILSSALRAEDASTTTTQKPAMDPKMAAAMEKGMPGENHKVLESLAGDWSYQAWWKLRYRHVR